MKKIFDYIVSKSFDMVYFFTDKMGIFYYISPFFTKLNELIHLSNTIFVRNLIKKQSKNNNIIAPNVNNSLENTGGIKISEEQIIEKINSKVLIGSKPSRLANFEGVALDDALSYKYEWRHLSFYPITKAIDAISKKYLKINHFSLLELGCGAGSIFEFLKYNDCKEYLGLDANIIALKNSPYIKGFESNFKEVNLDQEINFQYKFDIIISFEVLEHLKKTTIPNILKTIKNHMHDNSIFLGTACLREMEVHLTVESKTWWLKQFEEAGLIPHPKEKEIIEILQDHHPYNWNLATSILFAMVKKNDN
ncbi:MAG: class I SAM-dependent methyltransferase [Bacteroidota bacterium]|nr:class I SAM-dependent methyltransferase [Bacteroidota bacterium]